MPDTKLKVKFIDIEVDSDGDPVGRGQIYYSLKVDGSTVASRSSANPMIIGSGGEITLGNSVIVTKSDTDNLQVTGRVSEKDKVDKDETDSFEHIYTAGDNWGRGQVQHAALIDRNLNVTVNYMIERV